jgi:hypothetical protein
MMDCDRASNNRSAAKTGAVSYIARMLGWVRTLVIWLLVLALPAQGTAAATMAWCSPGHHSALGAVPQHDHARMESAAPAPRHLHETGEHAAGQELVSETQGLQAHLHHDADRAMSDAEPDTVVAPGQAPAQKLAQADQHNCSACAACCSAAAFSSNVVMVPAPQFEPTEFSSVVPSVDRFVSGGPDRPPRPPVA